MPNRAKQAKAKAKTRVKGSLGRSILNTEEFLKFKNTHLISRYLLSLSPSSPHHGFICMGGGLSDSGASRRRRRLRRERRGSLAADARVPAPTTGRSRALLGGLRPRRAGGALVLFRRCKWNSNHCKRLKHHLGGGVASPEQGRRREQQCQWRPRRGRHRRLLLRRTGAGLQEHEEIKRGRRSLFLALVSGGSNLCLPTLLPLHRRTFLRRIKRRRPTRPPIPQTRVRAARASKAKRMAWPQRRWWPARGNGMDRRRLTRKAKSTSMSGPGRGRQPTGTASQRGYTQTALEYYYHSI
jgi:hypothetical protein